MRRRERVLTPIPSTCAAMGVGPPTLSRVPDMAPFSSCESVLPIGRSDRKLRVGYRETDELYQIDQIQTIWHGNTGRFNMVEGSMAEMSGQTDLKEVNML